MVEFVDIFRNFRIKPLEVKQIGTYLFINISRKKFTSMTKASKGFKDKLFRRPKNSETWQDISLVDPYVNIDVYKRKVVFSD